MAYPSGRFNEDNYHVYTIDEDELVLTGGGDFYDTGEGAEVDEETKAEAQALADKYGMVIDSSHGTWQGWSEYSPDPGDLSVFKWHKRD